MRNLSKLKSQMVVPFKENEIKILRDQTQKLVSEKVAYYSSMMGVTYQRITIRVQKTRWGSCSSRGNLSFNCLLALVPEDVLEYVVVHELCHLIVMNHSERFWEEVHKILPNYAQSRCWLRENGSSLIARI